MGASEVGHVPAEAKEEVDEIRSAALAALVLAATTILSTAPQASAHVAACDGSPSGYTLCAIHHWRNRVWKLERILAHPRTRYGWTADRQTASDAYRVWVRRLWYRRWLKWHARLSVNLPAGIRSGLDCIHPKESVDWHRDGGMGPDVSGGLQIALATWQANGGSRYAPAAYLAMPIQQMIVGAHIVESSGWGPWPETAVACGLL